MTINNPILSLTRLNDLESRINSSTVTSRDLEEIDFFISSVGGEKSFIKKRITQNDLQDYDHYIREKANDNIEKKVQVGIITGSIMGAISFLKSYAIKNNFIV